MMTDTLSLFEDLTKASITTEIRLRIDSVKKRYDTWNFKCFAFMQSVHNIAVGLKEVRMKAIMSDNR